LLRIADELTHKLIPALEIEQGVRIEYDLQQASLGHGRERAESLGALVGSGIMSVNEARNILHLADIDGGDVLRAPVNMMSLNNWLSFAPGQDASGEPTALEHDSTNTDAASNAASDSEALEPTTNEGASVK
jgi:hypothetical protein